MSSYLARRLVWVVREEQMDAEFGHKAPAAHWSCHRDAQPSLVAPQKAIQRKRMQAVCPLAERATVDAGPRKCPSRRALSADPYNLLRRFRELLLEQANLFNLVVRPLATVSKRNHLVVLIEVAQGHG